MKRLMIPALLASCFLFSACEKELPENKVPSVVKNTLQSRYANTSKVEWEKNGEAYEAEFEAMGKETTVKIGAAGNYLMQKKDLTEQEVPAGLLDSIRRHHSDLVIDDIEQLETVDGTYYQIELDAGWKGDKQLVMQANGVPAEDISYWD
jgi:hypothetical protein